MNLQEEPDFPKMDIVSVSLVTRLTHDLRVRRSQPSFRPARSVAQRLLAPAEVRPDVRAAPAARLADEPILDVG
jgi:hypothetical protein